MAQTVGTVLVVKSNRRLLERVVMLQQTGYVTVPNARVLDRLEAFMPAFCGAFFFTATIGVLITVLSVAVIRLASDSPPKKALAVMLLSWAVCLIHVNSAGFTMAGTLFWAMVPPVLWRVVSRQREKVLPGKTALIHLVALVLFVVPWTTRLDAGFFSEIRNELLLGNAAGRAITRFYYRNTLFAANLFKSLGQKSQRTVHLFSPPEREREVPALRRRLVGRDWLMVSGMASADLDLVVGADTVSMQSSGREVLRVDKQAFRSNPSEWLKRYAEAVDRHAPFRTQTFAGLLLALILTGYGSVAVLMRVMVSPFRRLRERHWVVAGLCVVTSWVPMLMVGDASSPSPDRVAIAEALTTGDTETRIRALKQIARHRLDVSDFNGALRAAQSDSLEERFWLAGALRFSKNPVTFPVLVGLLDDPNINVACRAYGALGLRPGSRSLAAILSRYPRIEEWYVQVYAYKALRRLGWRQNVSAGLN